MKFNYEKGRFILLICSLLLLSATVALVYTYPGDNDSPSDEGGAFVRKVREEWYRQSAEMFAQRDFAGAGNLAGRILRDDPEDIFAGHILAAIEVEKNLPDKAAAIYEKILYLNPDSAVTRNNLAVVLALSDPVRAEKELLTALRLAPEHPAVIRNLMLLKARNGNRNINPETLPAVNVGPEVLLLPEVGKKAEK